MISIIQVVQKLDMIIMRIVKESFDGVIYKLWGYNKDDVPYIKSALNYDNSNPGSALSRSVQNGDKLHFIYRHEKGEDKFAFLRKHHLHLRKDRKLRYKLKQCNDVGVSFSNCSGANIYIDGKKQEGILTDSEGKVTLPELEAGRTYFITAEKLITTSEGIEVTDISAAYSNVTVVPSNEQSEITLIRYIWL